MSCAHFICKKTTCPASDEGFLFKFRLEVKCHICVGNWVSASEATFTDECSMYSGLPIRRRLRAARGCRGAILPRSIESDVTQLWGHYALLVYNTWQGIFSQMHLQYTIVHAMPKPLITQSRSTVGGAKVFSMEDYNPLNAPHLIGLGLSIFFFKLTCISTVLVI